GIGGPPVSVEDILQDRAPRPKVLDMFAGGGAIPLEALRLGCEAYALDLNPVAHIIELCTLVYPQKYGKPDPIAKGAAKDGTWAGLAEEVRYWGQWVLEKVKAEIGDLYPPIPDPKTPKIRQVFGEPQLEMAGRGFKSVGQQRLAVEIPAGYLTPVAYLWTLTVRCKNPSCGATAPLVKQTWLCKKTERYVALKMIAPKDEKRVRFEVVEATGEKGLGFDPAAFSKGGNATCPFCGTVADSNYVKAEGCAGRIGQQMMAVVCTKLGQQGKAYLSADDLPSFVLDEETIRQRIKALCTRTGLTVPDEPIIDDVKNSFWVRLYGRTTFSDLFTPRQMLCLLTFTAAVREAETEMRREGYDRERVKALTTGLGCVLDKQDDFNSSLCMLKSDGGRGIVHTFGRQALPMVWDFAEANPFNKEIACWEGSLSEVAGNLRDLSIGGVSHVSRGSALSLSWQESSFDAVVTDPPYYDNVSYADLSDFFYVWLKRAIGHLYPEHFATGGTPKKSEAVADAVRHAGNKEKAKHAYESMMAQSFAESHRVLKPGGHMVVVYAHKTTLGWATLVDALRQSGFCIVEAWPLATETSGRLIAQDTAALASSIFLVARKREGASTGSYEDDVRPELERIVRERVETLWEMGIVGADLVIAAVGAGLRAFTRFERVEYANGEEVPAKKFLAEVEGVVLETLLEKIFGVPRSGVAAVDGPSRFYVLWRYTYKATELEAGEAIVFTYGQAVELDGQRGLSSGSHALVEKKKGKYRLHDFTERGQDEKLGLPDTQTGTPAPLIDVLHRVLWLIENEPRNLTKFLDESRPDRERLRLVAQALAGAGLKGKSEDGAKGLVTTTTSEQAALGKLLSNWRALIEASVTPLFDSRSGV
ncbi:MAG: DUF1156 domain-containing protein, partial [Deltaproteobacteria bacterium]|nr:DUF1156 domain-containing protein [Deltaproteobacteria bacterium]